ncbi:hypothetical protein [Microcystis sp. M061S2]|uniref:hypothetical protein n=1 Tax=Microcystis sp. M061S2 TaxID=2771171 RepID=UPI0025882D8A|nr:hypothetical protein [Microcystis sp. M061S2]MCA2656871.1 hypothetical protein [Microcystis sp. M061S2]
MNDFLFWAGFVVVRELMHAWERQKLINKLMSRNFGEYVQSEMLKKPKKPSKSLEEDELPEDLRQLQEFGPL